MSSCDQPIGLFRVAGCDSGQCYTDVRTLDINRASSFLLLVLEKSGYILVDSICSSNTKHGDKFHGIFQNPFPLLTGICNCDPGCQTLPERSCSSLMSVYALGPTLSSIQHCLQDCLSMKDIGEAALRVLKDQDDACTQPGPDVSTFTKPKHCSLSFSVTVGTEQALPTYPH